MKPHITGHVTSAKLEDGCASVTITVMCTGGAEFEFAMERAEARRYGVGQDVWLELRPAPRGGK